MIVGASRTDLVLFVVLLDCIQTAGSRFRIFLPSTSSVISLLLLKSTRPAPKASRRAV